MPDDLSLHPFDELTVRNFAARMMGAEVSSVMPVNDPWKSHVYESGRDGLTRALTGDETGANAVTFAFAQTLATHYPSFLLPNATFTPWEARIDRGLGMLLRPPSRLFGEAGVPTVAVRAMPIRLDIDAGRMGGAYIPARLMPELAELLDSKRDRLLRRLAAAELDAVTLLGQLMTAAAYAAQHDLALFEASGVITPRAPEADPPGARVVIPDRRQLDPIVRRELEAAARPAKPPGLMSRLVRGRRSSRGEPPSEI